VAGQPKWRPALLSNCRAGPRDLGPALERQPLGTWMMGDRSVPKGLTGSAASLTSNEPPIRAMFSPQFGWSIWRPSHLADRSARCGFGEMDLLAKVDLLTNPAKWEMVSSASSSCSRLVSIKRPLSPHSGRVNVRTSGTVSSQDGSFTP